MPDFRTFQNSNRGVAIAMQQVQDPAGWLPKSLGPVRDWAYRFSAADRSEIIAAVDAFRAAGEPLINVSRENFSLGPLADLMGDVRRELLDGRGMVMMQNLPTDELDREGAAIAYLGLGAYLGHKMAQNKYGHVLGHVKNLGEDYGTTGRSYNTNAEIRFHSDACDYVGLLCLQKAKSGGASRVGSSVTVYNKLLERRPDLVEVLTQDFYRSHNGEMSPEKVPGSSSRFSLSPKDISARSARAPRSRRRCVYRAYHLLLPPRRKLSRSTARSFQNSRRTWNSSRAIFNSSIIM